MKALKFLSIVLSVIFVASVVKADEAGFKGGRFIGGVGLGLAPGLSGFSAAYNATGGGLDGYIGFTVTPELSALLAIDSFVFATHDPNVYSAEVNFAPGVRYTFGDSSTRFFVIGGLGLNNNIAYLNTPTGTSTFTQKNFMVEPGAGVQIALNDALNIYLQAKFVEVFADAPFSYLPITVGLDFK